MESRCSPVEPQASGLVAWGTFEIPFRTNLKLEASSSLEDNLKTKTGSRIIFRIRQNPNKPMFGVGVCADFVFAMLRFLWDGPNALCSTKNIFYNLSEALVHWANKTQSLKRRISLQVTACPKTQPPPPPNTSSLRSDKFKRPRVLQAISGSRSKCELQNVQDYAFKMEWDNRHT